MDARRPSVALSLARLRRTGSGDGPTMAEASRQLAECSDLMPILFLGALGMVPSPGLPVGMVCGSLVVWLALAPLVRRGGGRGMPRWLAEKRLPPALLDKALRFLVPLLRRIERRTACRLPHLASGAGEVAARLSIALQGVLLALPLGNQPPGVAILALAAGLMWKDGMAVLAGHVLSAVSVGLLAGLAWLAVRLTA